MQNDRRRWVCGFAAAALLGVAACDRGTPADRGAAATQPHAPVPVTEQKPTYSFAEGLEEDYPAAVGFLRTFLETALAGDYAGYRRLVARSSDPESRARFEKILNSLRSLTFETIEETEVQPYPPPVYVATARVDFLPDRKVTLRRGDRSTLAILVLREEGELRMALAPSALQPGGEEELTTASAPATTSAPSYPWQADADY